jgi:hypothetical protein
MEENNSVLASVATQAITIKDANSFIPLFFSKTEEILSEQLIVRTSE